MAKEKAVAGAHSPRKKPAAKTRARKRSLSGRPSPKTRSHHLQPFRTAETAAARLDAEAENEWEAIDELAENLQWRRPPPFPSTPVRRVSARPLHILMVGWEFPPNYSGGLGVHVFELCREITLLGHRITHLSPFAGPFTPIPGVTFRYPTEPPPSDSRFPPTYWSGTDPESPFLGAMDAYNAWVSQLDSVADIDVVHVHDWFGTVGGAALARRLNRPLVMTVHSTEYDRSLGHPYDHILHRELLGVAAAQRVIAVSKHLKNQLVDRYGAAPDKVRVIYNAVRPTDRLSPLKQSKEVVLYLGRLAAMKGVDTFLRAAARVAPQAPGALFIVAGEGPEYPRLLQLATHLGISERVLFLGHVTDEERAVLLSSASVFVLPSVVEPFGIAALEAMAAGVPTIISKTSGVAEITGSAFAVDFWDIDEFASRIAELLQYPVLRRSMGESGRWDALRQGWPERALETLGVYLEVLPDLG